MQNRSIKQPLITGILMLPMMAALADAPIVQGHPAQPVINNPAPVTAPAAMGSAPPTTVSAPSTSAEPLNASTNTQSPDQALVTGVDSDTSANPGSTLDISNQITMLQQQVQDLRGQLEVQGHVIAQLQAQVAQLSGGKMTQAIATTPAPTSTPAPTQSVTQPATTPAASTQSSSANTVPTPAANTPAQPAANNAPAGTPASNNQTELQLYQNAYNLMAAKQYSQATVALQTYLQQYPNGQYAANSHYWLGELALIGGNTTQAQNQFNIVINQFSQSPKAADSMLKLGMIFYEQQQWQQAKAQFNAVIKQYPNTTTAQLAQQQLQQIQQSGS
jgi:tol-pal system protein YbgF